MSRFDFIARLMEEGLSRDDAMACWIDDDTRDAVINRWTSKNYANDQLSPDSQRIVSVLEDVIFQIKDKIQPEEMKAIIERIVGNQCGNDYYTVLKTLGKTLERGI